MGSYDNVGEIVFDIKKFRALGMPDDEIDVVLEEDGVEYSYRQSAFKRLGNS